MQIQIQREKPKQKVDAAATRAYDKAKQELSLSLGALFSGLADKSCFDQSVAGQEIAITGALRGRVNDCLTSAAAAIDRKKFKGVAVRATTFLQKQESAVGSDFVLTFEVFHSGAKCPYISKSILVQAKTAVIKDGPPKFLHCRNKDLPKQLKDIALLSPNRGFLMLYTDQGAYVVPAERAAESLTRAVLVFDLEQANQSGYMMEIMANCTGGDTLISPLALKAPRDGKHINPSKFAEILTARANSIGPKPAASLLAVSVTVK
jgi:hypothetical protein